MASPAEIVRAVLLKANLVIFPGGAVQPHYDRLRVPCYVKERPNAPDNVLCLYDQAGATFGTDMHGDFQSHPGVNMIARSVGEADGADLLARIAEFLGKRKGFETLPVRGFYCVVGAIHPVNDIISLNEEEGTNRHLWSMPVRVALATKTQVPLE